MLSSEINNPELKDILTNGEAEWLKNAPWTYGADAINVWEEEILPRFMKADLKEVDVEDLRLYCPLMMGELRSVFVHDYVEDICKAIIVVLEAKA